eukprot:768240-Hanusia_phi.AAC.2
MKWSAETGVWKGIGKIRRGREEKDRRNRCGKRKQMLKEKREGRGIRERNRWKTEKEEEYGDVERREGKNMYPDFSSGRQEVWGGRDLPSKLDTNSQRLRKVMKLERRREKGRERRRRRVEQENLTHKPNRCGMI